MPDEPFPSTHPAGRRRRLTRRAVATGGAVVLAAAVLLAPGRPVLAQATPAPSADPERFVTALAERAFQILRETSGPERERALAGLLDSGVDLRQLARLVLGRHWNGATEAQRAEYVDLFRAYALQGLTSALANYTGRERLTVGGSRPASEQDVLVSTELAVQSGPPNRIEWRVRRAGERPVVVDVVVEGVSLLITNRSEVDSIVGRVGIDGLLREMRSWRGGGSSARPDRA